MTSSQLQGTFNQLVESTAQYLIRMGITTTILGISGGIDSTVVACICNQVSRKYGIPFLGFSLPCSTNKETEISTAQIVGMEFCDEFHEVNLQPLYEITEKVFNSIGLKSTPISKGNIKARLRGNFLYNVAGIRKGIVMDTDNMTEHLLGFWTISGGDECDFNPIGQLWKHEVYELAEWIQHNIFPTSEGIKQSLELTPTDGNGISESDLDQIAPGCTYDMVDDVLQNYLNGKSVEDLLCSDRIIERHIKSEFKRKQRPLIIDIQTGDICEKNGNVYLKYE